jgi:hypothetical protein
MANNPNVVIECLKFQNKDEEGAPVVRKEKQELDGARPTLKDLISKDNPKALFRVGKRQKDGFFYPTPPIFLKIKTNKKNL